MLVESFSTAYDKVIGGFTVIGEKVKDRTNDDIKELLPFWISNADTFSNDLNELKPIDEVSGISDIILTRLKELNVVHFFPVQSTVIPYILSSYYNSKYRPLCRPRDVCICAPTGSGKTLSYAIPIIQLLLNREHTFVRVLIILPVRDLAVQVYKVLKQLTAGTELKIGLLAGIQSFLNEQADLIDCSRGFAQSKVDIVVATPGRLVDHIYNSPGFSMERLRFLIIDEADRVISEEKQDWYHVLEEALYYPIPLFTYTSNIKIRSNKRRRPTSTIEHHYDISHDVSLQKILVSATLTHDPGPLKQFNLYFPKLFTSNCKNQHLVNNPSLTSPSKVEDVHDNAVNILEDLNVETDNSNAVGIGRFSTPSGLKEFLVSVPMKSRPLYLVYLIRQMKFSRILCFTNARLTADRLYLLLNSFENISVKKLSAKLPVDKRQRIINAFSRGDCQLLICTDTMARGMDIPDVQCVVSYEMPPSSKIYVHRVGRTARAGKAGLAYTFLNRNQFYHFKNDMKNVGKSKFKEAHFHSQYVSRYQDEYRKALGSLESAMKFNLVKPKHYFKAERQTLTNSVVDDETTNSNNDNLNKSGRKKKRKVDMNN